MIEKQIVPIPFGAGLDTKSDSKAVPEGKLLVLENGIMTSPHQIKKRNGYDQITNSIVGGGSLSAPKMIQSYGDGLICEDSGNLYSYSSTLSGWVNQGKYPSIKVSNKTISTPQGLLAKNAQVAQVGNYIVYVWTESFTNYAVFDSTTSELLFAGVLSETYLYPAIAALSSTKFAVVLTYGNVGSAGTALGPGNGGADPIVLWTYSVTSSGVTLTNAITPLTNTGATPWAYDIVSTPTGATLAYIQGNYTETINTISTSGAIVNSYNQSLSATRTKANLICVGYDSTNSTNWVYVKESTGSTTYDVYLTIFTSTLSVSVAKQQVTQVGGAGSAAGYGPDQMCVYSSASNVQYVAWCVTTSFSDGSSVEKPTVQNTYRIDTKKITNTAGTLSESQLLRLYNASLQSKPFSLNGSIIMGVMGGTSTLKSVFFVDITSQAAAIDLYNSSSYIARVVAKAVAGRASIDKMANILSTVLTPTSTTAIIPAEFVVFQGEYDGISTIQAGVCAVTLDAAHKDANQCLVVNDTVIMNGGIQTMYDGRYAVELGFNVIPCVIISSTSGAGGSIGTQTVNYIAIAEWTDAQGNIYNSAPSLAASHVFSSGSTNFVTLQIANICLTTKTAQATDLKFRIFRNNPANGVIYNEITSPLLVATNSMLATYFSYTDGIADADLTTNPSPYTYPGGPIVENTPPPPSMLMAAHQNRLWFVDSETNDIWYSKTVQKGVGIHHSDLLTITTDAKHGKPSAIASMWDKLVIGKDFGIYVSSGDGANDAGQGATLTTPQPVPSDVGILYSKSVCLIPSGLMFKSPKGIYLLDGSLQVKYLGGEVESYNAQNITSAVMSYDKNHVRFLTSSGSTLIYDYAYNQWGVFTNHLGYSATIYNGKYTYAKTDGYLYQESSTTFLDGSTSYRLKAQTAWLKFASLQGFQRVRRIAFLGDYVNGSNSSHAVQASYAYDYGTTFTTPVSYAFGNSSTSGVFQFRDGLPQQKCESISILLEETGSSGISGESVDFTDLAVEVGIKKGIKKMQSSQSV